LEQFLADAGELSLPELLAVLLADQRCSWEAGERLAAEKYLALSPTLQADLEYTIQLLYGEFLLREELGDSPTLEEYGERFPAYAGRLRQQVDLHRALASRIGSDPGGASTPR